MIRIFDIFTSGHLQEDESEHLRPILIILQSVQNGENRVPHRLQLIIIVRVVKIRRRIILKSKKA
jgi:hypothetical protein